MCRQETTRSVTHSLRPDIDKTSKAVRFVFRARQDTITAPTSESINTTLNRTYVTVYSTVRPTLHRTQYRRHRLASGLQQVERRQQLVLRSSARVKSFRELDVIWRKKPVEWIMITRWCRWFDHRRAFALLASRPTYFVRIIASCHGYRQQK